MGPGSRRGIGVALGCYTWVQSVELRLKVQQLCRGSSSVRICLVGIKLKKRDVKLLKIGLQLQNNGRLLASLLRAKVYFKVRPTPKEYPIPLYTDFSQKFDVTSDKRSNNS